MVSKRIVAVAAILVATIGTTSALVAIFTHTFPTKSVTTPILSTTCSSIEYSDGVILPGTTGFLLGGCGAGAGNPAFTVTVTGNGIPQFTLPSGITGLSIVLSPATTSNCPGTALTSASPFTFTVTAQAFFYCVGYNTGTLSSLPSFAVAWNQ